MMVLRLMGDIPCPVVTCLMTVAPRNRLRGSFDRPPCPSRRRPAPSPWKEVGRWSVSCRIRETASRRRRAAPQKSRSGRRLPKRLVPKLPNHLLDPVRAEPDPRLGFESTLLCAGPESSASLHDAPPGPQSSDQDSLRPLAPPASSFALLFASLVFNSANCRSRRSSRSSDVSRSPSSSRSNSAHAASLSRSSRARSSHRSGRQGFYPV